MSNSFKFNGKEVENPILRLGIILIATVIILAILSFVLAVLPTALVIVITLVVLTLPLHIALRVMGRKGFYSRGANGSHMWSFSKEAFMPDD